MFAWQLMVEHAIGHTELGQALLVGAADTPPVPELVPWRFNEMILSTHCSVDHRRLVYLG